MHNLLTAYQHYRSALHKCLSSSLLLLTRWENLKIELETATRTCSYGFASLLTHILLLLYEKLLLGYIRGYKASVDYQFSSIIVFHFIKRISIGFPTCTQIRWRIFISRSIKIKEKEDVDKPICTAQSLLFAWWRFITCNVR